MTCHLHGDALIYSSGRSVCPTCAAWAGPRRAKLRAVTTSRVWSPRVPHKPKHAVRVLSDVQREQRRKAGRLGGPARAALLTPERRREIARLASVARWSKR
jgi:hypothetical protein